MHPEDDPEPIHTWFELSYSSYLVVPRSVLQSMPRDWQARFVALLLEGRAFIPQQFQDGVYGVRLIGEDGASVEDPLADYNRGRTRLWEGTPPVWLPCAGCEDFFCRIHEKHAHDCACPSIECWETSPYEWNATKETP